MRKDTNPGLRYRKTIFSLRSWEDSSDSPGRHTVPKKFCRQMNNKSIDKDETLKVIV